MQRIATLLAVCAPVTVAAQGSAATQLWRLAGTTLAVPAALTTGGASAVWNPAQRPPPGRASICMEIIQTPSALGTSGVLVVGRIRLRPLGELGILYGNMEMSDLIRTGLSPTQDSGSIPYYAQFVAGHWTMTQGGTTLGATVGLQDVRLDDVRAQHVGVDIGVAQMLPAVFRVAAAAHLLAPLAASDPNHTFFGGVERRMWRSDGAVSLTARYGIAFGYGSSADHQVGLGLDVSKVFLADLQFTREAGYGVPQWRATAGIRINIGHYGVSYARDAGTNDIGSAYRVGLEAATE